MSAIIKRNLLLYFRDRMAVFFSLLSVLISLGIYFLFLSENIRGEMIEQGIKNLDFLMDSWFLAGTLGVVSVTTTLGSYGTMIDDEVFKTKKDFMASPIKRSHFALSYIISACIIGAIMSIIVLLLGEIFIVMRGGSFLSILACLKVISLIILSVASGSAMMFFLSSFLHTSSSFSGASTVIGVLVGFLTGLYMPIGALPEFAQNIVRCIPTAHGASLFRQVIMEDVMNASFAQAPPAFVDFFKQQFGVVYLLGGMHISSALSILFLIGTILIFFFLSFLYITRKKA